MESRRALRLEARLDRRGLILQLTCAVHDESYALMNIWLEAGPVLERAVEGLGEGLSQALLLVLAKLVYVVELVLQGRDL